MSGRASGWIATSSARSWFRPASRISEALGTDIDNLDVNRGHHTLFILRKGGKGLRPLVVEGDLDRYGQANNHRTAGQYPGDVVARAERYIDALTCNPP